MRKIIVFFVFSNDTMTQLPIIKYCHILAWSHVSVSKYKPDNNLL